MPFKNLNSRMEPVLWKSLLYEFMMDSIIFYVKVASTLLLCILQKYSRRWAKPYFQVIMNTSDYSLISCIGIILNEFDF